MITVMLYGVLGKKFGRVHRFAVKTGSEAVRALTANFKDFPNTIRDMELRVLTGSMDSMHEKDHFGTPLSGKSFRIVPVIHGAKDKLQSIGTVILGATLLFFTGGTMGWSLVLAGVAGLFMSTEESESNELADNKPSFAFDRALNTTSQGSPIPVCYGQMRVGSLVLSSALSTEDLALDG